MRSHAQSAAQAGELAVFDAEDQRREARAFERREHAVDVENVPRRRPPLQQTRR